MARDSTRGIRSMNDAHQSYPSNISSLEHQMRRSRAAEGGLWEPLPVGGTVKPAVRSWRSCAGCTSLLAQLRQLRALAPGIGPRGDTEDADWQRGGCKASCPSCPPSCLQKHLATAPSGVEKSPSAIDGSDLCLALSTW